MVNNYCYANFAHLFLDPVVVPSEMLVSKLCIFIIVDSKHESSSSEVEHVVFCLFLAYHSMPFPSEISYYGLTIKKLIDEQLQERGRYPYNTYKFIEKVVSSDVPNP